MKTFSTTRDVRKIVEVKTYRTTRTKKPRPEPEVIIRVTQLIPFEMDLVQGEARQVIVPPSKLKDVGNYWFMDDSRIRRRGKLGIRKI